MLPESLQSSQSLTQSTIVSYSWRFADRRRSLVAKAAADSLQPFAFDSESYGFPVNSLRQSGDVESQSLDEEDFFAAWPLAGRLYGKCCHVLPNASPNCPQDWEELKKSERPF